jgi:hypothetical protein
MHTGFGAKEGRPFLQMSLQINELGNFKIKNQLNVCLIQTFV